MDEVPAAAMLLLNRLRRDPFVVLREKAFFLEMHLVLTRIRAKTRIIW